jgi:hypothetical protein
LPGIITETATRAELVTNDRSIAALWVNGSTCVIIAHYITPFMGAAFWQLGGYWGSYTIAMR